MTLVIDVMIAITTAGVLALLYGLKKTLIIEQKILQMEQKILNLEEKLTRVEEHIEKLIEKKRRKT